MLNKGLPIGSWLAQMGLDATCISCNKGIEETIIHCLRDCSKAACAWNIFERIWELWGNWGLMSSIP
jgi:hypothetical protein